MKIDKKALCLTLEVTILNSVIYYLVKILQGSPTLISCNFDSSIPFIPYFVYFYVLWYVMLILVPLLFYQIEENTFYRYIKLYISCALIANIIFLIFPTTIKRASFTPNSFTLQVVDLIYFLDVPALNCFPSMHCIVSFLFISLSWKCKKMPFSWKVIISSLSFLVILSTLFIKQHVLYDVISAFVIVLLLNIIYDSFLARKIPDGYLSKNIT